MQAEETAAAAERSRFARDLHDAVTQTLFSASIIAEVIPKIWTRNPEEGRDAVVLTNCSSFIIHAHAA
ncbi:MAG: histidine kinase dimerization/phosphoacceptor domain-containing protein [Clostridia bacterium]|nr:histidine kinase dimerization/phosphoacceptor domain-containing protein [Clostridia bacterium]